MTLFKNGNKAATKPPVTRLAEDLEYRKMEQQQHSGSEAELKKCTDQRRKG